MIYVSLSTIPQRVKDLNKSIESLLKQTKKADKIVVTITLLHYIDHEKVDSINDRQGKSKR